MSTDHSPSTMSEPAAPSPGGVGASDTLTRRVEHYEIVDATAQLDLWRTYRSGQAAEKALRDGHLNQSADLLERVRQGHQALDALIGSLFRLAIKEVNTACDRRFGAGRKADLRDDIRAEAYAAMMAALESFDPEKGASLSGHVVVYVRGAVRSALQNGMSSSWARVSGLASRAESTLTVKLARRPTDEEIRAEVVDYCLSWAKKKLVEAGSSPDDSDLDERAHAKLVKQGTWAAIESIDDIRSASVSPLSLDAPTSEGSSLLDLLGDATPAEGTGVIEWFLSSLETQDRYLVVRRFGLDGEPAATFESLGTELDVPWTEVRSRLSALLGRLTAPHALFVDLEPSLDLSAVDTPSADTPAKRLAARREAARSI